MLNLRLLLQYTSAAYHLIRENEIKRKTAGFGFKGYFGMVLKEKWIADS
jgi:hypothetical protein